MHENNLIFENDHCFVILAAAVDMHTKFKSSKGQDGKETHNSIETQKHKVLVVFAVALGINLDGPC